MKALIIIVLVGAAIFGVVKVLGGTLGPAEWADTGSAVRGDLEKGNTCRADQDIKFWTEPKSTSTARQREEMFVGVLEKGEIFVVKRHFEKGGILWVYAEKRDDPDFVGWFRSHPVEPVHATKINPDDE